MKRNTFQKAMIFKALQTLHHPTADDIYAHIILNYPQISKGTVYRNLSQMVADGRVLQIKMPDGPDHYDHTTCHHYHCKCHACNRVFDMDLPYREELDLIRGADGFIIQSHTLIFNGLCADCNNKQQMED